MSRLQNLQLVGPVTLFCAVAAAEGAVYGLARAPSSEVLWYLNIDVFGAFQRSYYLLSEYLNVQYLQLFGVALPLLGIAVAGLVIRRQLLLAIASNLSFVYASFLLYAWHHDVRAPRAASLISIGVPTGPDFYMFAFLLGAALMSFVVSHVIYLGAVRARA